MSEKRFEIGDFARVRDETGDWVVGVVEEAWHAEEAGEFDEYEVVAVKEDRETYLVHRVGVRVLTEEDEILVPSVAELRWFVSALLEEADETRKFADHVVGLLTAKAFKA